MELSNCCNARVYIDMTEGEVNYYVCTKCQEVCDIGGKSFKEENV